ncbi:MAG TPA: NPCBM/NEW2 domain-containing protein [Armatimonadota bacterium]|jgi:dienelactone hydrolase
MQKLACVLLLCLCALAVRADAGPRPLWTRGDTSGYVTAWSVCGPFFAARPALTLERDYQQGKQRIREGAPELRADGQAKLWKRYIVKKALGATPTPVPTTIELAPYLGIASPDHAVMYAFTRLTEETARNIYLAVERSRGVRVELWLNGELFYSDLRPRSAAPNPIIHVSLRAGENTVLLKLDCSAEKPTFALRVLDDDAARLRANTRSPRELHVAVDVLEANLLGMIYMTVYTGDALTPLAATPPRGVAIRVTGPGGHTVATALVKYGESATFESISGPQSRFMDGIPFVSLGKVWADGGYDITCRLLASPTPGETRDADTTPVIAHAFWYKGDALAAAREFLESAPSAPGNDQVAMIYVLLADLIRDRLGAELRKLDGLPDVQAALMEWEEVTHGSQFFTRLAYRDAVDGSAQFARVYLPPGYDPAKRYPLIVQLHGMVRDTPPYLRWGGMTQRYDGLADRYGALVLYPHGRANAWYRGLGEQDVLRALALTQARFAVDPDRIYLLGYSMGGAGVWHVGTAHPELFAALAPYFGGREPQVTTPAQALKAMTAREKRYAARDSSFAQAESLRSTPIFVSQGDEDKTVPPDISRYGVRLLHNWGYPIYYWEMPGKGHGGLNTEDTVLPWLLAQRREAHPAAVRLRAANLAGAQAHWLRVLQREKADAFVQASAEVIGPNLIRLETDNALAVRLTPGEALVTMSAPLQVIWNGKTATPHADGDGVILYASGYTPAAGEKTAAVEGPIGDIFNTPFLIVIGTSSSDPAMRAYLRRYAQREVAWWQAFQQVTPRVAFDDEVSAEDCARYSLLLVGGPGENGITQELAGELPLQITPRGFTIDGAYFPVRDGGVLLTHPNPRNAARYVVVAAANSAAGMYRLTPFNNRYDVDYAVVDGGLGKELTAGLFDRNWRYDKTLLERHAPTGVLPRVPALLSMATTARRLSLCEVLEERTDGDFDYLPGLFNTLQRAPGSAFGDALCFSYFSNAKSAVEYTLTGGDWKTLQTTLGLNNPSKDGKVTFSVKGDGKELYRSRPFDLHTGRQPLRVKIDGVTTLRLEVEWSGDPGLTTACWDGARVEK